MATSGVFTFEYFITEILEQSYRNVGGLADGQSLTNEQIDIGKKLLNAMIKAWRADNIFLWKDIYFTLPMQASSQVSNGGSEYKCILPHTSAAENEPGVGTKWPTFWILLSGTPTSPAWVTATAYVSANTYDLPSQIVDIQSVRIKTISTNTSRPLTTTSQSEFFDLSNQNTLGQPTQYYFRRNFTPQIQFYPFPDSTTEYLIEFWGWQYPEDVVNNNETPDFLQDYQEALVDGLALRLCPSNGIFGERYETLKIIADKSMSRARKLDHETGDIFFQPDMR